MTGPAEATVLWEPSAEQREAATLTRYMRWLEENRGLSLSSYDELWRWSVGDLEGFWGSVAEYFAVRFATPPSEVLGDRTMPGARWFPGAELNYAEHIFRAARAGSPAVLHASELRELGAVGWDDLERDVARCAAGLRSRGVERGDRVVAYLPNIAEALVAFLACASLGAIWSSCSPDFGAGSVTDRFAQIEPKVLFAVDGYRYGGRDFDRSETVRGLEESIPTLEHTILVPYLDPAAGGRTTWAELLASGEGASLEFTPVPFDHPLWVLYSSGTTGLPKAIVHGHGGILLEHLKKAHLHSDLHPGDRFFWFTTTGWMMWNFLVGGLLAGATIVLYDGNPGHPDLGVLWDLAERAQVTCFGTSASFLVSCLKAGIEPARGRDLSGMRSLGSTGSPLPPEGFAWVYEHVKPDVWLFSTSGGTDVCTAFVGACPLLPVRQGELQARSLGADVQAWDEQGRPLEDEVGELVITQPMPSMPVFFWNDPDGERYRASYFDTYPGIWRHGDWIRITPTGGAVIYGRSDSTINRQGVRMGTSEIYRVVNAVPAVADSLVVDVPRAQGESWMPLFVVLAEGAELDDELRATIRRRIREECSPRHVPNDVFAVGEIPRTLNGKVLEVPVKRILSGVAPERAASLDSLANPSSLDFFVELAARESVD
jgi:acetoacetyl-CoA synthetase